MRTIDVSEVTALVRQLCIDANYYLPADLRQAFVDGQQAEESPLGKTIFGEMIANCDLARENKRIHASHLDLDSRTTMLYDAVNIVLGQGQTHLTNSSLSPCARCYTIGEGLFNVLARIDIQTPEGAHLPRDIPSLTHAFIGSPLYIRYKERPRYYSGAPQLPAADSPYMNWDILADTR